MKPLPSFNQHVKPSGPYISFPTTSLITPSSSNASISSFALTLTFTKLAHTIGNLNDVVNFKKRGEDYCNNEASVEKRVKDAMVEKGKPLILEVSVWVQSMAKRGLVQDELGPNILLLSPVAMTMTKMVAPNWWGSYIFYIKGFDFGSQFVVCVLGLFVGLIEVARGSKGDKY